MQLNYFMQRNVQHHNYFLAYSYPIMIIIFLLVFRI